MQRFVDSIRASLEARNWFGALFVALAIPDVCGALEDPKAANGERYRGWFVRYMKAGYDSDNAGEQLRFSYPERWEQLPRHDRDMFMQSPILPGIAFNAADCWKARCTCLHQGLSEIAQCAGCFIRSAL
jgi:hypothetical protein